MFPFGIEGQTTKQCQPFLDLIINFILTSGPNSPSIHNFCDKNASVIYYFFFPISREKISWY